MPRRPARLRMPVDSPSQRWKQLKNLRPDPGGPHALGPLIQNNLPISRSLINHICKLSFFHVRLHIHRLQGVRCGHLCGAVSLPTTIIDYNPGDKWDHLEGMFGSKRDMRWKQSLKKAYKWRVSRERKRSCRKAKWEFYPRSLQRENFQTLKAQSQILRT